MPGGWGKGCGGSSLLLKTAIGMPAYGGGGGGSGGGGAQQQQKRICVPLDRGAKTEDVDIVVRLCDLAELRSSHLLSEQEFREAKRKVLAAGARRVASLSPARRPLAGAAPLRSSPPPPLSPQQRRRSSEPAASSNAPSSLASSQQRRRSIGLGSFVSVVSDSCGGGGGGGGGGGCHDGGLSSATTTASTVEHARSPTVARPPAFSPSRTMVASPVLVFPVRS